MNTKEGIEGVKTLESIIESFGLKQFETISDSPDLDLVKKITAFITYSPDSSGLWRTVIWITLSVLLGFFVILSLLCGIYIIRLKKRVN